MKLLVGKNTPENIVLSLRERGFHVCFLPPSPFLSHPVSTHPDMLAFQHGDKIILGREYYGQNRALIDYYSLPIIIANADARSPYPTEIAFDCFYLDDILFCKEKYTPSDIKSRFSKVVNVKQGYAKCSSLVLPGKGVITDDEGIAAAVKKEGYDSVTVPCDEIMLPGYDRGFIGGASFVYNDTVLFTGDFTRLSCNREISDFCSNHRYTIESLTSDAVFDCGSFTRCPE